MSIKKFKKIKIDNLQMQKFQDNTKIVLDEVTNIPVLDGILLTGLELSASTTNEVNHKLGRAPLGWIVVRKRAQADVWDLQDVNSNKNTTLSLACSSDVIVDIWIF